MTLFWVVALIASLGVMLVGANWFLRSAEQVGRMLKISPFVVGVIIVAIGTSLPELLVSLFAVFRTAPYADTTQIVVGTVIGSNIANILLIGGVAALLARSLLIKRSIISLDLPLLLVSAVLFWFVVHDGEVTMFESIVMIAAYVVYFRYTVTFHKTSDTEDDIEPALHPKIRERQEKNRPIAVLIAGLLLGVAGLYFGAEWIVRSVVELASLLGLASSTIALTAVAIGTSLPEVLVSTMAAIRGAHDVAVGNIIGSNIFNTFIVIGISGIFAPLVVTPEVVSLALPAMLLVTLLFAFSALKNRIHATEGALYLMIYGVFLAKTFNLM